MAARAPDVAALVALRIKSQELLFKGHDERHANYLERTLAAARALGVQNCLVTAHTQLDTVARRLNSAMTSNDLSANRALRSDAAELLLCAGAALQARRAAGTLLPGTCHAYESDYEEGFELYRARHQEPSLRAAISRYKVGGFFGCATFLYGATHAAHVQMLCSIGALSLTAAQRDELWLLLFDGLDMMAASGTTSLSLVVAQAEEAHLVNNARQLLRDGFVPSSGAGARVRDAWRRLERSGVLDSHKMDEALESMHSLSSRRKLAVQAAAVAAGLRTCALPGCGARERHPSHFKTCGACKTVAYCSKEHQTSDWPRHKADCKVARKA